MSDADSGVDPAPVMESPMAVDAEPAPPHASSFAAESFFSRATDPALPTAPPTLAPSTRRPWLSRKNSRLGALAHDRRAAILAAIAAVLLIAGIALSGLGIERWGLIGFVEQPASSPAATQASTATLPPAPTDTPSPTPNPNLGRNAAMGCAQGVPVPTASVLFGARDYQTGGAAPREVALTFDDGPTPYTTPPILDELERTHTPATFFVLGLYTHIWPYLVQREWSDGFAIGVHSWDHPYMTFLADGQMPHQFGDTLAAIHSAIGLDTCIWFWRPPYGAYNAHVVGIAQRYRLSTVMWNADPSDWARPGPQVIANRALAQARPGSIVVMHDGPAHREQTLAALPLILDGLRARGLTPVTLPRLLADSHYPGVSMTPPATLRPTRPPRQSAGSSAAAVGAAASPAPTEEGGAAPTPASLPPDATESPAPVPTVPDDGGGGE
jgi:peptidoglycan/xylan/chitin deacetylase (PgdA/CDA1 family)